jgi:hypothetical protein
MATSSKKIINFRSFSKITLRQFLILALSLVVAIGGYLYWEKNSPDTPKQKKEGQIVIAPTAYFETEVFRDLSKTIVKTIFKPPAEATEIWLTLETDSSAKQVLVLISHPLLDNLDWPHRESRDYTLFQRKSVYKSVEEFLSNPPSEATIIVDPLIEHMGVISAGNIVPLESDTDLSEADYILTTFHKLYEEDGYKVSDSIVDASGAFIENGKLTWALHFTNVSEENSLILKGVDITYLHPPQGIN